MELALCAMQRNILRCGSSPLPHALLGRFLPDLGRSHKRGEWPFFLAGELRSYNMFFVQIRGSESRLKSRKKNPLAETKGL